VWHQGRHVEVARRVNALANCFVKRNATTHDLEVTASADEVPIGLSLRDLISDNKEIF
jgi:hypothetical protein